MAEENITTDKNRQCIQLQKVFSKEISCLMEKITEMDVYFRKWKRNRKSRKFCLAC